MTRAKAGGIKDWLAASAAAAALLTGAHSFAQGRPGGHAGPLVFKVPAQSAQKGITEFARQANVQILAPAEVLRDQRTAEVVGELPLEDALTRLLTGSGLIVAYNDGRTVSLVKRPGSGAQAAPREAGAEDRPAQAQVAPPGPAAAVALEGVTVIGSQIAGSAIATALPVTVFRAQDFAATGATSGGEFFRNLPQAGDVTFNEQTLGGNSPNAARGDISTVTLRGLGQGNTLLLLNGRRMVQHPTSQTDGFGSPVLGYNANAIPLGVLDRVEVLRDGASALYGSDAVAGVINNVIRSDFTGLRLGAQYGYAQGTHLAEQTLEGIGGARFGGGRGQVQVYIGYTGHSDIKVSDQAFTRSANRSLLVTDPAFAGNTNFDGRTVNSPFGAFQVPVGFGPVRTSGTTVTNASGAFHIQPASLAGCTVQLGAGLCVAPGNLNGADQRPLRFDASQSYPGDSVQPALIGRINLYGSGGYELRPGLRLYGELGYYSAVSDAWAPSNGPLASLPITVAANAYWNPLGPSGSPNRLAGLAIPASGLPLTIVSYNLVDAGPNEDKVVNSQIRALTGVRGQWNGWTFDTALLYSAAKVDDTSTAISSTLFQAAVNRTGPDAYNPFNGGSLTTPSVGDPTPNPPSVISSFRVRGTRADMTQLALWDLKTSRPDLYALPGGSVGLASGVEFRYETYRDDRDARQDGSIPYIDSVTGVRYGDDLLGASPSPDVAGSRAVASVFGEVAIPLIGPRMGIPLVKAVSLQAAGRFEDYSDVGAVAKPKLAGSWDVVEGLRLRGSWSQGFRAPNLETLHSPVLQRSNQGIDYLRCEMDLRARRIASYSTCSESFPVVRIFEGNPQLKPEESENYSFGAVLRPRLPPGLGGLTLSIDSWRIAQMGVIGVVDYQNAINLDDWLRQNGGSNPAVVRMPVTADDVALAAGTGLAPAGQLLTVKGVYQNLLPRTVAGIDLGANWRLGAARFGELDVDLNYARLTSFFQEPSADQQTLLRAQAAGALSKAIPIAGAASLIGQGGNPADKWTATVTWRRGPLQAAVFIQSIGPINDPGVVDPAGQTFVIRPQLTASLYGQWTFSASRFAGASVRLGVRNLANTAPPLSSGGYLASVYSPMPRYLYLSVQRAF